MKKVEPTQEHFERADKLFGQVRPHEDAEDWNCPGCNDEEHIDYIAQQIADYEANNE